MKLSELADELNDAHLLGEDRSFSGVNEAGRGRAEELEIWLEGPVKSEQPVITDADHEIGSAPAGLAVKNLGHQLPHLLSVLKPDQAEAGVAESAQVADDFKHGREISVADHAVIGPNVQVGDRVRIGPGVTIRGDVTIEDDVWLRSGVRIESPARIGDQTTIHANTVIGSDGFGYNQVDGKHEKIPQIGKVVIGARVEIGALVTVDRAMFGETVIGAGTKIDNMVHIGHNCKIGENVILISMTGVSGSVELGDNVVMAGQSGVKDHVSIADGVTVAGRGGVTKDIDEEGVVVSGYPARDHREHLKEQVLTRKLPELQDAIERFEEQLGSIQAKENQST